MIIINNLEEMEKYYNKETKTYEFYENGKLQDVTFNCDIDGNNFKRNITVMSVWFNGLIKNMNINFDAKLNKEVSELKRKRDILLVTGLISSVIIAVLMITSIFNTNLKNAETHTTSIIEQPKIVEMDIIENAVINLQELLSNSEQLDILHLEQSKTYMDYRAITDKKSKQYKLLQELIYTDDGYIQTDDGYIAVALGSYFGDIGQKYVLELTGGKILKVIKVDEKSDTHTKDGYINTTDGSVVEFIVDSEVMVKGSNGMPYNGNFNNNEGFNGQIQTIYKEGE